ncbi:MAG: hypothetical protein IT329_18815 [Caldilineaceae bacterium]|nr:hypothetical protein [Caldilineaceae bacterium]
MTARRDRRNAMLMFSIQFTHTLVFFALTASIFYLLYSAIANRLTRWTGIALAALLVESAVMLLNKWQCPLRGWAEALGAERGSVTDIFLPRWLADRIFTLCTPLYALGFAGVAARYIQQKKRRPPV